MLYRPRPVVVRRREGRFHRKPRDNNTTMLRNHGRRNGRATIAEALQPMQYVDRGRKVPRRALTQQTTILAAVPGVQAARN